MSHRLVYNDLSHIYSLNGRRPKSVTAVAKIPTDGFALEAWRRRQVAVGFTLEPRLAERIAVDLENRDLIDEICEEATRIAGAHQAAHRGTQRHRASELADTGGTLLTEQQRDDAAAWRRTLDHYGIEVIPELVEQFVIWPDQGVVGRVDRFCRYRGRTVVLDLKSGRNAVKYAQSTSVQLSLYGRAPLISAGSVTTGDKTTVTEWRTPPADTDLKVGYIVLLGDGMELGELWEVDLAHGWAGAQLALSIVDWRKGLRYGDDIAHQVGAAATTVTRLTRASLLGAIRLAKSEAELLSIWRAAEGASTWTEAATEAARVRKAQLAHR